jgi:Raf kinase inhibitor-like YbhB/YbcL family protein
MIQTIIDVKNENRYARIGKRMRLIVNRYHELKNNYAKKWLRNCFMNHVAKVLNCMILFVVTANTLLNEGCHVVKPMPVKKKDTIAATPSGRPSRDFNSTRLPSKGSFILRSPDVADGGTLPKEFTGDGASATLPLEWSGAPTGTKSYAVIMHHIDPEGKIKWYWILYNIPANVQSLPKNVKGVGTLGNNSVNGRTEYAPPHSKGPGPKSYIYTVYALSAPLQIKVLPDEVNRDVLLSAMKNHILCSAELKVIYTRYIGGVSPDD